MTRKRSENGKSVNYGAVLCALCHRLFASKSCVETTVIGDKTAGSDGAPVMPCGKTAGKVDTSTFR